MQMEIVCQIRKITPNHAQNYDTPPIIWRCIPKSDMKSALDYMDTFFGNENLIMKTSLTLQVERGEITVASYTRQGTTERNHKLNLDNPTQLVIRTKTQKEERSYHFACTAYHSYCKKAKGIFPKQLTIIKKLRFLKNNQFQNVNFGNSSGPLRIKLLNSTMKLQQCNG